MGKAINAILLIVAIEFALFLFQGQTDQYNNSLFSLVMNPVGAFTGSFSAATFSSTNAFFNTVNIVILAFIALSAVSLFVPIKQDTVIFMLLVGFLLAFFNTIAKLWNFIYGQLGSIDTSNIYAGTIASIMCAPLVIAWIIIMLDYGRGRD